jgi:hypothetical protein
MPLVRRGPGLVRGVARTAVVAGTASAVSGRVRRRQDERWAAEDQAAYEQQMAQQAPAAAAPEEPSYMAELAQLAQLRDQGILTPEEFEAKKKQLLGL